MKDIVKQLRKNYRDMDKPLFFVTVIMFIVGLLSIVSASSREAVVRYGSTLYHYFFRQLIMLTIGLVLSLFIININSKKYKPFALVGFVGINILLLYEGNTLSKPCVIGSVGFPTIGLFVTKKQFPFDHSKHRIAT